MESSLYDQKRPGGYKYLFFGALIAVGSAILPFGLILAGAYFAFVMYKVHPLSLALTGGLYAVVCYTFYGGLLSAALTGLAILPAVLLYALHKLKQRVTTIGAVMVAADVLLLYAILCLPGVISGAGAFAAIQSYADEILSASRETAAAMASTVYGAESAAFLETFDAYLGAFSKSVPELVVPVMCSISVTLSVANFLFFRLFAKNRLPEIPRLPKFSAWRIPNEYTGGLCFFLIGSLVLELFGFESAAAVSSTVNVLVGVPFMIQGLATIDFIIERRAKNKTSCRVIVYILVGLLYPLLQSALMLLGCVEQLFNYRARISALPPRMPKF